MSMNIYIGPKMAPWQTPTEVTDRVLAECRGSSFLEQDLSALDLLEAWVLETSVEQLIGKDARNPFLLEQQAESVRTIKAQVRRDRYSRRCKDARQIQRGRPFKWRERSWHKPSGGASGQQHPGRVRRYTARRSGGRWLGELGKAPPQGMIE